MVSRTMATSWVRDGSEYCNIYVNLVHMFEKESVIIEYWVYTLTCTM